MATGYVDPTHGALSEDKDSFLLDVTGIENLS
jgi:hypothetical protein